MKINTNGIKNWLQCLDRTVITQRLQSETTVHNGKKNTTRVHQAQGQIEFSLRKALTVGISLFLFLAGTMMLWKKCVECKLIARLKKRYFFLPVDRVKEQGEKKD